MEKWFTLFVFYLFPHWRLYSTPWMRMWLESQRQSYINVVRFSLVAFILTYLAHHFFVDTPLGLNHDPKWIWYRFGISGAGLICLLLTFRIGPHSKPHYYKFPLVILGILSSYFQTQSMLWYSEVPYLWGIVIPIIFTAILKFSTFSSLLFCFGIYAIQFNHYLSSGLEFPLAAGACFTGLIFVAIIKRSVSSEVINFIEHQEKIDVERRLVESKRQMTEQVQGFLPRIINERIARNMEELKMSVLEAVDEELRPKEKMITCLYSDIRSYTKLSKDADFIKNAVFPDTHEAIAIVEELGGIPRTIGDLVFAYFDGSKIQLNVIKTVLAGYEIHEATNLRNQGKEISERVTRFLIMTAGPAIVGNIGGAGSAREITALGSCVNKSARIDEFTKYESVKKIVTTNGILMDSNAYFILSDYVDASHLVEVSLSEAKEIVRDFEDEEKLWFLKFSPSLIYDLENQISQYLKENSSRSAA